jgi:hypothetical protein
LEPAAKVSRFVVARNLVVPGVPLVCE